MDLEPAEIAKRLPSLIRFGTSSWTYEGWKGTIYHQEYSSEKEFNLKSLGEYALFPLFRTVGIDSTFYRPPNEKTLLSYTELVPSDFRWVSKVWEDITAPVFPKHARYGARKGEKNLHFLNSKLFMDKVLGPYERVKEKTGPFVFQFPTIAESVMNRNEFLEKLHSFLGDLPSDFKYAIEIRNPAYLTREYFSVLNDTGATHCFNHWQYMPPLRDQMKAAAASGGLRAPFFVSRILTPLGVSYEEAVKLFSPYDKIKRENPEMRKDVVLLARRGVERKAETYVIINNRCEGNSPSTIDAIGRMIVSELDPRG